MSPDGKQLEDGLSLSDYGPKERAVIVAINPYTPRPTFSTRCSTTPRLDLAKAIAALFGPGGTVDRAGLRAV